jgi:4-hydroxybenzoyl-CoA thioesterase
MTARPPSRATEWVLADSPFRMARRVRWGECDPAGIVYTACFTDYVISAAELFMEALFDRPTAETRRLLAFGSPANSLQLTFHRPLFPDEVFVMEVSVHGIATRGFTLALVANSETGDAVFEAFLGITTISLSERRSITVPSELRSKLAASQAADASAH